MSEPLFKLLLVEDNPGDALLVREALNGAEGARFEVHCVGRLAAAIACAGAERPDVMLLDLGLPDAQGLETFVRARAALPELPVIVLSGLSDEAVAIQAVQQGAQDYLLKGAALEGVLPRAIRYAIERHRAQEQLARYANDLQEKNAVLEEELRLAREIQQALLPRKYPQFYDLSGSCRNALRFAHCYRPATALSGDFFNILRLSDKEAGVLICDVMGHGVRAALIAALARGLIDQFNSIASDPGKFLTSVNRGLADILKQAGIDAFASAFYLVADVAERQVRFANAGHPDALMLRRDAGAVDWLRGEEPHHPPLGLLGDSIYPTMRTALARHDSVVLFTDGVYEEEDAAGRQFGRQRLFDAMKRRIAQPCGTLLDDVVQEIQQYSGHAEFADDVCMVGIDMVNGQSQAERASGI